MRHLAAAVVGALALGCTKREPAVVEYVGSVRTPAGYLGTLRVAVTDGPGTTPTLRWRLYTPRTDSLIMSRVIAPENCTVFSVSSWTCGDDSDRFTLDSNTLQWAPAGSPVVVLRRTP